MDAKNLFLTTTTYRLLRLEYGAALVLATVLFFMHLGDIRWIPFVVLFAYIDLIGYIPGTIAYHRSRTGHIPRAYYVLYNVMHSMFTQGLVAGLWMWLIGPEWALLALPIHLCGDRALFGNFLKPFAVDFEPKADPAFERLQADLRSRRGDVRVVREQTAAAK
ncbi:MAG TPA: hypothetical protein VF069_21010 [Streptosporangiaceae bacterium]